MAGSGIDDALSEFYSRLKGIKEYYRSLPSELAMPFDPSTYIASLVDVEKQALELDFVFSGEEGWGRYLDLHQCFRLYSNLKGVEKINYLTYLDRFERYRPELTRRFKIIPQSTKMHTDYYKYLVELEAYLLDWIKRAKPLFMWQTLKQQILDEFEDRWAEGTVPLWERPTNTAQGEAAASSAAALYCVACERLFSKQTVFTEHFKGKKHIKAEQALKEKGKNAAGSYAVPTDAVDGNDKLQVVQDALELAYQKTKPTALLEFLIASYVSQFLSLVRDDTKSYAERKQALTEKERLEDQADEPVEVMPESDGEEEGMIYNPLKLPIGWDGKPIPFWLYKLHGLGIEYPCEICGGYVYMGRKAFEKHFSEYRHTHGMKSLGIPNSKFFQDITSITDAYALAEKLKKSAKAKAVTADIIEEFEDEQGNVFNRKTYEGTAVFIQLMQLDLKRQGII
ncbi:hypothetical protein HDV03_004199 [Kappamyces sp. JEL0829]|nr:hypothetical protein HDV03_004199 [Kappamyces sp. JEL0829]